MIDAAHEEFDRRQVEKLIRADQRIRALEAEAERLREAGDALADAVSDIMGGDPESVLHTWAQRWRAIADSPPSDRTAQPADPER